MSCEVLQERFRADPSRPAVRNILRLLRQQPGPLHTSLVNADVREASSRRLRVVNAGPPTCLSSSGQKTCVIDELYQFEFFSELLQDLGAEIALSMP